MTVAASGVGSITTVKLLTAERWTGTFATPAYRRPAPDGRSGIDGDDRQRPGD
jgi:hypothetical protein